MGKEAHNDRPGQGSSDNRRIRIWKAPLVAALAILLIGEAILVMRQQKTQMVASKAMRTAAELITFSQDRSKLMERGANESFEEYKKRIATANAETQSLYSQNYYSRVAHLRDELARHGLRDPELDEFCKQPPYPIAIREVGEGLLRMGLALRSWTLF